MNAMNKKQLEEVFKKVGKEDPSKTYTNIGSIIAILVLALENTKNIDRNTSLMAILSHSNSAIKKLENK